jgi:hypothetical protein
MTARKPFDWTLFAVSLLWIGTWLAVAVDHYRYHLYLAWMASPFLDPGEDPGSVRRRADFTTPLLVAFLPMVAWCGYWTYLRVKHRFR